MARSTVAVRFTGDTADLKRGLGQVDKGLGGLSGRASKMSTGMKVALGGAATLAVKFGKDSVDAFVEAEESQKALADAFERFPNLAGTSQEALQKYNSELQKKTRFDDDAIASGQAVIAQFGVTGKQLESLTPLLLDYAARTGKDLPAAAQDVGKAMLGNAKALKNIGIKYTATGDKAKDFANIQELLRQQVGGFAEKEGTTAAGKLAILKNQFGELEEKVGSQLVPALSKVAEILLGLIEWFSKLSPAVQVAIGVLVALAAGIFAVVKAVKAWEAAQAALDVVLNANPIGLIIIAIAAFVAALVLAYTKVGWFRKGVDAAFHAVKAVILGVFNWVKSNWPLLLAILTGPIGLAVLLIAKHWGTIKAGVTAVKKWIVDRFNDVVGFVSGLPGKMARSASSMWNWIKDGFRSAINGVVDIWNGFRFPTFKIPRVEFMGHGVGGGSIGGWSLPHMPRLAKGGVVDSPMLAMLGDGTGKMRREIATPEQLLRQIIREEGGGTVHNWHVAGSILAERDVMALINRAERKGIA